MSGEVEREVAQMCNSSYVPVCSCVPVCICVLLCASVPAQTYPPPSSDVNQCQRVRRDRRRPYFGSSVQ